MKQKPVKSVFTALFAAIICAGSVIAIPIGPVPITLQNAFAIMAGLLLGPLQGAGAVGLFLLAGALGLPVFSGGKGGLAIITGPTGGYLAGYFIGALVAGFALERADRGREANEVWWLTSNNLLNNSALSTTARYWIGRSLYSLAKALEADGHARDARAAYELIIKYDLPSSLMAKQKISNPPAK